MAMVISSFVGTNRFLSNFYPSAVIYNSYSYRTVEHAYQASKSLDPEVQKQIRMAFSPFDAKRMGRKLSPRPDFFIGDFRVRVMRSLLRQKFGTEPLRGWLANTRGCHLIEGNTWGDVYWGQCHGKGENHLGRLLMEIREENLTRPRDARR